MSGRYGAMRSAACPVVLPCQIRRSRSELIRSVSGWLSFPVRSRCKPPLPLLLETDLARSPRWVMPVFEFDPERDQVLDLTATESVVAQPSANRAPCCGFMVEQGAVKIEQHTSDTRRHAQTVSTSQPAPLGRRHERAVTLCPVCGMSGRYAAMRSAA